MLPADGMLTLKANCVIVQTNEVNQGDSLEYNFGCMYTTLLLPIKHRLGARVAQVYRSSVSLGLCAVYDCVARAYMN